MTVPLLVVMNPRAIPECMDAFAALTVPKVYLTGYTERELEPIIADLAINGWYSHLVVVSDDVVVSQRAVDAVYAALTTDTVVTGWCNLDDTDARCSVVDRPLTGADPTHDSYGFMHWSRIAFHHTPLFRTWFAGMCLTGMSREMWQRFPFRVHNAGGPGFASDFNLCTRLQAADIPVYAVRDAGTRHVRERWDVPDNAGSKRLLVGEVEPMVTFVD